MNVTLVYPTMGRDSKGKYTRKRVLPPLQLSTLAGLTPKNIDLNLVDDRIEDVPYDEPTDLVGISVDTYSALRSYEIAEGYRRRGIPVVLGGFHPTLMLDEARQHADSIVVGQAENVWPALLNDFSEGRMQKVYRGSPMPNQIVVDNSFFKRKEYIPITLIEAGRGCPFTCDFCSVQNFFGKKYYPRPVESIRNQIEESGNKWIIFVDDNIASNPKHLGEVCSGIADMNISWASQMSLTVAKNERLMDQMTESGCQGVLIGFESLNKDNLNQMSKNFNGGLENYLSSVKKFRERGIRIYGTFAVGYDWETTDSVEESLRFALDQKFSLASFYPLTPFPGTELIRRLDTEGRLTKKNWWLDSEHRWGDIVFNPKNMSPEELSKSCRDAMKKFYSFSSTVTRTLDFEANVQSIKSGLYFLLSNYLTWREIDHKNSLYLGVKDEN